jgi:hypothetical protein
VGAFVGLIVQLGIQQRQRRADLRIAQAALVSGWVNADGATVTLANNSSEPIYEVVATFVLVQGAGPRRGEDLSGESDRRYVHFLLPPGRYGEKAPEGWRGMFAQPGIEVAFTDRKGISWIRRADGTLEEVSRRAFDHFNLTRPISNLLPPVPEN